MFALRMLVTLAILVPVWVIRQPRGVAETFVIALIAFGAGHLVEALVKARRARAREAKAPDDRSGRAAPAAPPARPVDRSGG